MECFIFEAADKYLGIEAQYIYRIADDIKPTPVPLVPPCYVGIVYYRGDLFDVIDIGCLLGEDPLPQARSDEIIYVILIKWEQRKLGLIPNRIIGLEWLDDPDGSKTRFTREGRTIEMITPMEIWNRMVQRPFGRHR